MSVHVERQPLFVADSFKKINKIERRTTHKSGCVESVLSAWAGDLTGVDAGD